MKRILWWLAAGVLTLLIFVPIYYLVPSGGDREIIENNDSCSARYTDWYTDEFSGVLLKIPASWTFKDENNTLSDGGFHRVFRGAQPLKNSYGKICLESITCFISEKNTKGYDFIQDRVQRERAKNTAIKPSRELENGHLDSIDLGRESHILVNASFYSANMLARCTVKLPNQGEESLDTALDIMGNISFHQS